MELDPQKVYEEQLFHSSTGLIDFVVAESELEQIADYWLAITKFTADYLANLRTPPTIMRRERD
jgi:hypothetical protein